MRLMSFSPMVLACFAAIVGSCQAYESHREPSNEPALSTDNEVPDASLTSQAISTPSTLEQSSEPQQLKVEAPAAVEQPNPAAENANPGAVPAPADESGACPSDMVLIEGNHCPVVDQPCVNWMEDPAKFPYARCAEFSRTPVCKSDRVHMRYCMDKLESAQDDGIPVGDISWTNASATCKSRGKRLCMEREWLFACEGEEMRPYPYGYVRDPKACNFEHEDLVEKGELRDLRQPVTSNPNCLSPFGVQNMVGNIDEWVVLDKPYWTNDGRKMMSGLKGGWWGPLRNRCRPVTLDHDEYFHELQTGFRCCSDAK